MKMTRIFGPLAGGPGPLGTATGVPLSDPTDLLWSILAKKPKMSNVLPSSNKTWERGARSVMSPVKCRSVWNRRSLPRPPSCLSLAATDVFEYLR